MTARLKDVAELAQVSIRTVSNVVNDYPHVSDHVRRRVTEAIQQLDYRPNLAARALRSGRSGLLALVAPFPPGLAEHVISQAASRKMRVVIVPQFLALPIDAALLCADVLPAGTLDAYLASGTPLVLLGEAPDRRCDHVAFAPAGAAVAHLLSIGRQRIAAVGAHPGESLHRAGWSVSAEYVRTTAGRRPVEGYQAARALLEHRPDAIFCDDDRLALGVIRAVTDAGLRVPDDVAVVGVGDSDEGRYARPSLTTVAADPADIARQALDLTEARLARPSAEPARVVVPHVVLPRESTRGSAR
ncbi:LacI family transcriptional regulator [Paractinoplanes toevensis]|uniref:LacI family transcriptional regulator n=2 Tax=Paractinoplanes toevensis TaxID=571911 RepID=A0A919T572_9ACTN|nr:LacI family transcriptional regulator [Actinoplanes toevensis]